MAQRGERVIEAARRTVPEGTFAVGLGLAISGITTYGFQIIVYQALPKAQYTALNGLWVVAFVLAPGFFLPLEQEVARALAHRRAQGLGGGPVVRRAAAAGALLAVILMSLVVVGELSAHALFGGGLRHNVFHGYGSLFVCLVISLGTYAVQHLTCGTLSGSGRFGPYGLVLAAEGIIRVLPCIVLWAFGVTNLIVFGLAFALPPLLSSIAALRGQQGLLPPGPEAPWSELSVNIGWLFGGSVLAQALSYSPVLAIIVFATNTAERESAADFIVGFFLARVPILMFQAAQAALLPKLAALSGSGRREEFVGALMKLVFVVVGIAAIGVIGCAAVGSFVGEHLFGGKFKLGNGDLALLAAGSGLFILSLTLAQALIALLGHARRDRGVAHRQRGVLGGRGGEQRSPVRPRRARLRRRRGRELHGDDRVPRGADQQGRRQREPRDLRGGDRARAP